jgi:hypothetical protein
MKKLFILTLLVCSSTLFAAETYQCKTSTTYCDSRAKTQDISAVDERDAVNTCYKKARQSHAKYCSVSFKRISKSNVYKCSIAIFGCSNTNTYNITAASYQTAMKSCKSKASNKRSRVCSLK